MKKKSIINLLLITIFATVLMGCDLSLDVPPHDWMIGNWTESIGSSTLEITTSNIIINYDGNEINLGLAGVFVDLSESAPSDSEYLIVYKKNGEVMKFKFNEGPTVDTMYLDVEEDGSFSGATLYNRD